MARRRVGAYVKRIRSMLAPDGAILEGLVIDTSDSSPALGRGRLSTQLNSGSEERVESALAACREARFLDALTLLTPNLSAATQPTAFLLYVRILLRTKPTEAVACLARHGDALVTPADRLEAALLLATAQARVGDYKSAHIAFGRLHEALQVDPDAKKRLIDELRYREALTIWMERKLGQAEAALKPLIEDPQTGYHVEALILDGAISAAHGRFEQQAATLLKALRTVLANKRRDVLHWAHVTAQLSYLAREMPSPSLRSAVIENVDAVRWTADIADLHFKTLKAVGWRYALEGDYLAAFRYLKRASRVAPSEAWQIMALCDRTHLAQSLGERRFTEQELDEVSEIAERVEWRAITGEERVALLLLAVLHAPTDGALALSYIARFQETGQRFDGLLSANDDRRVKALGFVYARLNYRDDALLFLKDAWTAFDAIGYDWRAARCAKEIAWLTRDEAWLARATDKIAPYSRSWIAAEIAETLTLIRSEATTSAGRQARSGRDALLTPAQREVYRLLMDGIAVTEIARLSNRSEYTIRNHIKAIFKAFNVKSRAALMRVPL
jgi:DNA-binding CsgD family transcriptional regulator